MYFGWGILTWLSPLLNWTRLSIFQRNIRAHRTRTMAHVLRPLILWPRWRHRRPPCYHVLSVHSSLARASTCLQFFSFFSTSYREVHSRSRALKLRDFPPPSDVNESDDESSSDNSGTKKSRNERKREARRAVRWGMELASFSPPQIKRILRVGLLLSKDVFERLMGFSLKEYEIGKQNFYLVDKEIR
ncbi:UNVERIFIED_CONTAM: hypothetical protein Scaly_1563700 [Sesamum calycinum]|uniref:Uncharacterized protein n=1 Tax=Sesamum calycinum TaxID=2727403 RepID=A0AAW2P6L3_9LAMI